jgi:RNA polymerase sigma-70 factor, ECF subfamily
MHVRVRMREPLRHGGADPEAELVDGAVAGDQAAFGHLVRRHQACILNLVRALTGGVPDSEDLAQEVFIRAFRSLGRFRRESSFKTWLHAIAVNIVRTHLARRAKGVLARTASLDAGAAWQDGQPRGGGSPMETSLVLRDAIDRTLARLPEDLRIALTLRDVQGLDYREIALALGVPIGTVESRIFRARQQVRPLLEPLIRGLGGSRAWRSGPVEREERVIGGRRW